MLAKYYDRLSGGGVGWSGGRGTGLKLAKWWSGVEPGRRFLFLLFCI